MREQRLSYGSPAGDVSRGVLVCVCFVPAGKTPELGLGFSVSLGDVSAGRTRPAGVAWVDGHTRDSDALRLVFDEGAKLPESPVVQPFPLLLAGLNPLADMRQVFQRNAEAGAFSSGNDCLRYAVVLVLLEPPLFAAHLPKAALCCFGADALQDGASFGVAFAVLLDCRAGVLVAFAVRGDVMAVVKCHPAGIGMTDLRTELGMSKTWLQRRVRAAEDCGLVRVERKIFGARSVWTVLPLADGEG